MLLLGGQRDSLRAERALFGTVLPQQAPCLCMSLLAHLSGPIVLQSGLGQTIDAPVLLVPLPSRAIEVVHLFRIERILLIPRIGVNARRSDPQPRISETHGRH